MMTEVNTSVSVDEAAEHTIDSASSTIIPSEQPLAVENDTAEQKISVGRTLASSGQADVAAEDGGVEQDTVVANSAESGGADQGDDGTKQEAGDQPASSEDDGQAADQGNRDKAEKKKTRISAKAWKQTATLGRVTIFNAAFFTFVAILVICIAKFQSSPMVEVKTMAAEKEAWFKLAICLRPFITPQLLSKYYAEVLSMNFSHYIKRKGLSWDPDYTLLDGSLEKDNFTTYFREVHPWNEKNSYIRKLWYYQLENLQKTFEEFSVNNYALPKNQWVSMKRKADGNGGQIGLRKLRNMGYTVLYPPVIEGVGNTAPIWGEYSLSPEYAGCLNMTVNRTMLTAQMDIFIRMHRHRPGPDGYSSDLRLFEVAELFVFHKDDEFTELPVIRRHSKFSFSSKSLTRLYITGELHKALSLRTAPCLSITSGSTTNCRYWCIMRRLFSEIRCTLPWMHSVIRKPWIDAKLKNLTDCSSSEDFQATFRKQKQYFSADTIIPQVQHCLTSCHESCDSSVINIQSLGSATIGPSVGLSLTMDASVQTVTQQRNYPFNAMAGELCASVSFLLGLSGISIYDWCIAFALWLRAKWRVRRLVRAGHMDAAQAAEIPKKLKHFALAGGAARGGRRRSMAIPHRRRPSIVPARSGHTSGRSTIMSVRASQVSSVSGRAARVGAAGSRASARSRRRSRTSDTYTDRRRSRTSDTYTERGASGAALSVKSTSERYAAASPNAGTFDSR